MTVKFSVALFAAILLFLVGAAIGIFVTESMLQPPMRWYRSEQPIQGKLVIPCTPDGKVEMARVCKARFRSTQIGAK